MFQSTLPTRVETKAMGVDIAVSNVSIHSTDKGRDGLLDTVLHGLYRFNPLYRQG